MKIFYALLIVAVCAVYNEQKSNATGGNVQGTPTGTSQPGTSNRVSKYQSNGQIGNSGVTDNGSVVSTSEMVEVASNTVVIDGGAAVAFQVGASSVVINSGSVSINSGMPVTISSAIFAGVSLSTQPTAGAGAATTALCPQNRYALGGGCVCTDGVALTGNTANFNCVAPGCIPTGFTCTEPGGTGGSCVAYVLCSRLQ